MSRFDDAQRTVEYLRSYGMDAARLEVVGAGLRQASRRRAVPVVRLTAVGALQGALLGVLAAVFITLVAETTLTGLAVVVWGFVYGVLVGALWGLFRGLVHNRPEAVTTETLPTRYEVRCPADELAVAQTLLANTTAPDDGRLAPQPTAEHKDAA
ncbi:hypothetical protein [Kribbella kalugense]|uniref:hypothetical protein n=1 Tax=Kribbella kalugense TaxID=2512221 RepID=UPI001066AD14|nr:hypothetical protein [Kribbella kalugense]